MNFIPFSIVNFNRLILLIFILSYVCFYNAQASGDLNYDENLNIYRVVALKIKIIQLKAFQMLFLLKNLMHYIPQMHLVPMEME